MWMGKDREDISHEAWRRGDEEGSWKHGTASAEALRVEQT